MVDQATEVGQATGAADPQLIGPQPIGPPLIDRQPIVPRRIDRRLPVGQASAGPGTAGPSTAAGQGTAS
jgi:hypothetical protein